MAVNRTLGLNRGHSSNFWWLGSANHVKFNKRVCDVYEACFSKKKFYWWDKYGFATMKPS